MSARAESPEIRLLRALGVTITPELRDEPPRIRGARLTARWGIRDHRAFEQALREKPQDENHRLPHVPAGFRGVNVHDPRLGPARPRATVLARQRARLLVVRWCECYLEFLKLRAQLAPLAADRTLDRNGVFRHPAPANDAKGPLCRGYPACPWCRLYMLRRELGQAFWWTEVNRKDVSP